MIKEFMGQSSDRFQAIDERFDAIDAKLFSHDQQFIAINERLDQLDRKYDHLITTMDNFIARLDKQETEQAARDSQFEKLLTWARKVSEKTGIPLENL